MNSFFVCVIPGVKGEAPGIFWEGPDPARGKT